MTVINCLKMLLYPFLPFSAQRLHEFLGLDGTVESLSWDFDELVQAIQPGNPLRQPSPLYTKFDPQVVDDEVQRLGASVA
jgi:methionyl-tRNA synthetase